MNSPNELKMNANISLNKFPVKWYRNKLELDAGRTKSHNIILSKDIYYQGQKWYAAFKSLPELSSFLESNKGSKDSHFDL